MIQALQLDMSVTLGDFIVTGGTILTIVVCYFAIKTTLETLRDAMKSMAAQVHEHGDTLAEHGEGLAALDAAVFGRRRQDPHTRARADRDRKRRLITEEGT